MQKGKDYNIRNLRDDLINLFQDLKTGHASNKDATTQTGVARTIISSATAQLSYNKHEKNKKKIKFLEAD